MSNNRYLFLLLGGFLFWLVLTLIFSVSAYIDASRLGRYVPFAAHLMETAINFGSWGLLAPVLFALTSSDHFLKASFATKIGFSVLAAMLAFVAMMIFVGVVTAPRYDATFTVFMKRQRILDWLGDMFLFVIVMLGGYVSAVIAQAQQAALKAAMLQSTLAQEQADRSAREATYLRGRLGSHFVMNALSNVLGLMRLGEVARAEDATILLSDILRGMTGEDSGELVPLATEIELAEKYLAFQLIRYPALESHFEIESPARGALVPNQLLQPLLENVFKHARMPRLAELTVTAAVQGEHLILTVANNSTASNADTEREGEGLRLTRLRLRAAAQHYAQTVVVDAERRYADHWYSVIITLPFVEKSALHATLQKDEQADD